VDSYCLRALSLARAVAMGLGASVNAGWRCARRRPPLRVAHAENGVNACCGIWWSRPLLRALCAPQTPPLLTPSPEHGLIRAQQPAAQQCRPSCASDSAESWLAARPGAPACVSSTRQPLLLQGEPRARGRIDCLPPVLEARRLHAGRVASQRAPNVPPQLRRVHQRRAQGGR
jgi:hypothetical protein